MLILTSALLLASSLPAQAKSAGSLQGSKLAEVPFPLSVSPDGRYVSEIGNGGNLAIRNLKSGETRLLTNKTYPQLVISSAFSADGEMIAYTWHNEHDLDDVRVVGTDGSDSRVLYQDPTIRSALVRGWSSNGEYLLLSIRRKDSTRQIARVSTAGDAVEVITTLDVREGPLPGQMAFSPDGRFVAYDLREPTGAPNHDVFVTAVDGSTHSALVEDQADDRLLGWALDGSGIVFASNRSGSVDVYLTPVLDGKAQGSARVIERDVGHFTPLAFGNEGSLYYGITPFECAVYLVDLDSETGEIRPPARMVAEALHNTGVSWAPDGRRLAHVEPNAGIVPDSWSLVVRSPEGTSKERITLQMDVLHQLRPIWSPDGRSVLANGWDSNSYPREIVCSIDVESGVVTTLLTTSVWRYGVIDWVVWSADGKALFYVLNEGLSIAIIELGLDSNDKHELYRAKAPPYVYGLATSPDGRYLSYGVWDTAARISSLVVMSLPSGEEETLVEYSLPRTLHHRLGFRTRST